MGCLGREGMSHYTFNVGLVTFSSDVRGMQTPVCTGIMWKSFIKFPYSTPRDSDVGVPGWWDSWMCSSVRLPGDASDDGPGSHIDSPSNLKFYYFLKITLHRLDKFCVPHNFSPEMAAIMPLSHRARLVPFFFFNLPVNRVSHIL